ncbi:MAG: aldo/keto reductase [Planctomycetaceae bacterium]|nr:aldo/keto reductase [Planctomycetaceae bacterium]
MEYRRLLGQSELSVSSMGMGCVTFGREVDPQSSLLIMDHAFEQGITLFDTAEAYAQWTSQRVVGEWMKTRNSRDKVVLATKVSGLLSRHRIVKYVDCGSDPDVGMKPLQSNSLRWA